MTDNLNRLLTEAEAAEYLGVTPETLARLRRARKIACVVVAARRYRYTEKQLRDFVAQQSQPARDLEAERLQALADRAGVAEIADEVVRARRGPALREGHSSPTFRRPTPRKPSR
jgi:excisionase family DNA binding protein